MEGTGLNLPQRFLRQCRRAGGRSKIADSTGADLSGRTLLLRTLILRRLLLREVVAADERFVGVLLPPSAAAVATNAALTLSRRVAVNLNYTVTSDILNYCTAQCGIRHVLTSRKFMEKMNFQLDAPVVFLEDLRERVTWSDKLVAAAQAFATPVSMLDRQFGLTDIRPDDLLTVIFTSGSTGQPKGVMLSFDNVASNVDAFHQVVHLHERDVFAGILPFFHSFGYTVTLWAVLTLDPKGAYHFSPLDAKIVGKLCREHRATILVSTPTFLRGFMKRCTPEEFRTLDVVVVGAEKMPLDLAAAFEQRFGVRPVEGYGTTELSPAVSVNVPQSRSRSPDRVERKEGSVGRPLPGITAKIVHPDTGAELPVDESGMLLIRGPNVMQGYLNQPEKTAEVLHDGWYVTGDIAYLDADGFIFITGRQSRFSKIAGEMVPHILVEEAIQKLVSENEDDLRVAVTSIPDARKGERLIVLHKPLPQPPQELCRRLAEQGLPNLWIPSPDSFAEVGEIPVLGSGKLDLKRLKDVAVERFPRE